MTTKTLKTAALLLIGTVLLAACKRQSGTAEAHADSDSGRFTVDLLLPMTPVKQQGDNDLCWIYAMLATIETERLAQGDSVSLSPVFTARQFLAEQAERYYLSQGRKALSLRGIMPMALQMADQYGLQPYDYYQGYEEVNWRVLARRVQQLADGAIARRVGLQAFRRQLADLLDAETGFAPRYVHMLGAEYTNEEFGRSISMAADYVALTSFSHHPYGHSFVLEVPDNQFRDAFLNVPPDSLIDIVSHALQGGHPVAWEGDISEPGFSFRNGVAEVPERFDNEHSPSLTKIRQQQFERFQTTDDHCMAIVGMAHNERGRYYIAKNSWGTQNPYQGLMFLSEDYLRLKTVGIVVPRTAITLLNPLSP